MQCAQLSLAGPGNLKLKDSRHMFMSSQAARSILLFAVGTVDEKAVNVLAEMCKAGPS
jgi:hypothetical protein